MSEKQEKKLVQIVREVVGDVIQVAGDVKIQLIPKKAVAIVIAIAVLIISVILVKGFFEFRVFRHIQLNDCVMGSGPLKVGISSFQVYGGSSKIGKDFSERLARSLSPTLEGIATIWNGCIDVEGDNALEQENNAFRTARDLGLDIVIYGNIRFQGNIWKVEPKFTLYDEGTSAFCGAHEVLGSHTLGTPIEIGSSIKGSLALVSSEVLEQRISLLAMLLRGIYYYASAQYDKAIASFHEGIEFMESNEKMGLQDEASIKALFYLFWGNAKGKQNELKEALNFYQEALSLKPGYPRAFIGMGSIHYLLALEAFSSSQKPTLTDAVDELNEAIRAYDKASHLCAGLETCGCLLPKISFGKGQTFLLWAFVLSKRGEKAEGMLETAQQTFLETIELTRRCEGAQEIRSESFARLGLISLQKGNLRLAQEWYRKAYETAVSPQRRAFFKERLERLSK